MCRPGHALTMVWHLQSRQVCGWLYGQLATHDGDIKANARSVAGEVQGWLIALRDELATELKAAAAESRRRGAVIRDHGDLRRMLGRADEDTDE